MTLGRSLGSWWTGGRAAAETLAATLEKPVQTIEAIDVRVPEVVTPGSDPAAMDANDLGRRLER